MTRSFMCHIRPLRGLGFFTKIRYPPSPSATPSGIKVFALCAGYTQILARLGSLLQDSYLPEEEGFSITSCSTVDTKGIPVTPTS